MYKIFFPLLFVAALFSGCDEFGGKGSGNEDSGEDSSVLPNIKPFAKGETVSRTLLVYLMAENSISKALKDDFDEI
ncbi:MAG: hypothetical protein J6U64_03455, partial [Alphaproteobacteria bacterium]|nr:hypothetical protein [Alphaproteobacteria bacterium]